MREFTYKSRDGDVYVLINVNHGDVLEKITENYTGCTVFVSRSIVDRVHTKCPLIPVIDGEEGKSIEAVLSIVRNAHELSIDRDGLFIGVGGGSVLDVVGFSASIYLRGVDYVNVPTTMLSMVDASLGGKTGVNALGLKNVIGVIRQPRYVIIDLTFLESLPMPNYIDGFAEVIKYGITMDRELLGQVMSSTDKLLGRDYGVLEEVIYRSLRDKASIVEVDELDRGNARAVLNYGHTVGHAIESVSNFSISHGRAVALGMICEARIGVKLGYTSREVPGLLMDVLSRFNLINRVAIDVNGLVNAMVRDKKRSGEFIKLPVVIDVGKWGMVRVRIKDLMNLVIEECGSMQ
ncbi:MAG: 3-dehydroquinate synthase [Vulcanisaeta sp.]|uniref:3-dehydroquinate synthase n=1 Tax=Vulcanisaeta sp. TaxID=2020871 RepID=UPI003D0B9FA1